MAEPLFEFSNCVVIDSFGQFSPIRAPSSNIFISQIDTTCNADFALNYSQYFFVDIRIFLTVFYFVCPFHEPIVTTNNKGSFS